MKKYNLEKRIEKINGMNILDINKKHIIAFIEDQAAIGNSKARQIKYLSILGQIAKDVKYDFKKAIKEDIKKLCSKINNSNMSDWTKHDYLLTIKVFYKFLRDTEDYPSEVKWIKPKKARNHKKLPRDLITIEDAKKLANHTSNLRDRCFVLMLYETGARISELLELKIKDVEFDEFGAKITLPDNGKTGARKIRVIASSPAISNWLLEHPRKNDKNAPLLCGLWSINRGKSLDYRRPYEILKELGEKAGVDKPLNPHHFRHSRATELAKKLTEAQLCEYMGWVIGSREAATYVHLSGRDMDKAILELHGLVEEDKEKIRLLPIVCPRCNIKNDPAAKFCSGCSLGLDEKSVMEYDKQKEIAEKTGFQFLQAGESTQDTINQALLSEIQALRKELDEVKKQK
jgi:site-specific recombinase XerD